MPDNNARLTARLAFVTSNQEPSRYAELRIEDAQSGLMVAIIPLNGDDLMDLLGNSLVGGVDGKPAWLLGRPHRDALGLTQIPLTRSFSTMPEQAWARGITRDDWAAKLDDWGRQAANVLGGISHSVTPHNNQRSTVTIRCYAPADRAEAMREMLAAQLEKFPAPTW